MSIPDLIAIFFIVKNNDAFSLVFTSIFKILLSASHMSNIEEINTIL